jgi:hypothetical protein
VVRDEEKEMVEGGDNQWNPDRFGIPLGKCLFVSSISYLDLTAK